MQTIDARGLLCPIPVIETKKAVAGLPQNGGIIKVLVDNLIATENLSKMCAQKGYGCETKKKADRDYEVTVTVGKSLSADKSKKPINAESTADECADCAPMYIAGENLAVAIGKDTMGGGNDELGRILIKGFIYSLLNLDMPPKTILFFNSGVKLTLEGANTLDDLKALTDKGTEIFVCGTCVDFYNCKDRVAVGEITNMYNIVEKLRLANSVINI